MLSGKKYKKPALLHPVRLRIAIEVDDLVGRLFVAQESERGDQCPRAHSGHGIEFGLGQRVLGGNLPPPLEKPRPEGSPIAPARYDQDVDHRRRLPCCGAPVVLDLGAFKQPAEQLARCCYGLFVAPGAQFQEILLSNRRARQGGTTTAQHEPRGEY